MGVKMRRKDIIILWPVYFDLSRTRREGRRLPKKLCIQSPNVKMLEEAVKNLGLKYEINPESAYPRLPWVKMGFISVRKDGKSKARLLREVALELIRASRASPQEMLK